jgi:hypothetical protein
MPRYDERRYWASHNSYSGQTRGSLVRQLDSKVRCLELDFWDNDYEHLLDYRLGHLKPCHEVVLGDGNPETYYLKDWLGVVAEWSRAHPDHAPITIVLDAKSDLTDNDAAGDLEDLNRTLEKAFGASLYTRDDFDARGVGEWPDTSELRGKVICVLSGNSNTRMSYRFCMGARPAIATNAGGDVVIAYRSSAGELRYWAGKARLHSRRVDWIRKGTYARNVYTVSEPSLALTDDGYVVSVHRVGPKPGAAGPALLECTVGELQPDGRIAWGAADALKGSGLEPSVALSGAARLQAVHRTASGKSLRSREGTLDKSRRKVRWKGPQPTEAPRFPTDITEWKGHRLRAFSEEGHVVCSFDDSSRAVGFRQLAFVERQSEEKESDFGDPLFYGASAGAKERISAARNVGLVARAWWFKDGDQAQPPGPGQENAAGTDFPFEQWYADYMNSGGQAEA